MTTLDVSDLILKGNALHLEINKAVQTYEDILPDLLILSQGQYDSLTSHMDEMYGGELMFRTPTCIMEVQVK